MNGHIEWLLWGLVAVSVHLRYILAASSAFHPEEAQIILPAMAPNVVEVYRAGLFTAYGPLMNFVNHFLLFFGSSELYLRLPSVIAGALLPYIAYKWAAETFGKGAGFVVACILAFSPELVILSAQLRFYVIHLFLIVCSLYFLEQAFRDKSANWMTWFGITLATGLMTMYMSIWYVIAIGLYVSIRILMKELPFNVVVKWVITQSWAAAVMLFAWWVSLRHLTQDFAKEGFLRASYFHPASQTLPHYLTNNTEDLFGYVFSNLGIAEFMMAAYFIGIVLILLKKTPAPRIAALSLVLPVLVTACAGVKGVYPYAGTRHDVFLSVFLFVGVAVTVSFLARNSLVVLVLLSVCLIPPWLNSEQHHRFNDYPQFAKREQLQNALTYLSTRKPRPKVVVADQDSYSYVRYYICHNVSTEGRWLGPGLLTEKCGGYQIIQPFIWIATDAQLQDALGRARSAAPDLFPDPVWGLDFATGRRVWETTDPPPTETQCLFGKYRVYRISQ